MENDESINDAHQPPQARLMTSADSAVIEQLKLIESRTANDSPTQFGEHYFPVTMLDLGLSTFVGS